MTTASGTLGRCPKEPREQQVQCQACLSIAESRPRVDEVNFSLPTETGCLFSSPSLFFHPYYRLELLFIQNRLKF